MILYMCVSLKMCCRCRAGVFWDGCCPLGCLFFFFQAEDGIRDHAQSRGLGDVYKRQLLSLSKLSHLDLSLHYSIILQLPPPPYLIGLPTSFFDRFFPFNCACFPVNFSVFFVLVYDLCPHVPVSYTHLTLPTICSVQISVVAVSLNKKKQAKSITQDMLINIARSTSMYIALP
eukprot:TRINITY_DN24586_c0_g1_i1.p1 TRINITY_DN24586_c0_g1~~TRINITY_DN24586_c0_g1_i1.p1  ORF type:complete len:174 (-),score=3.53 TRINITY_DN24586_c0_g1_i1:12-533(-)